MRSESELLSIKLGMISYLRPNSGWVHTVDLMHGLCISLEDLELILCKDMGTNFELSGGIKSIRYKK